MSFNEADFIKLNKENRFKKVLFALKEYILGDKDYDYIINLLNWLKKYENFEYLLPKNKIDWQILYNKLFKLLLIYNPFIEEEPFDDKEIKITTFPIKVILDNIRSPFNVGSILRTSQSLGVNEIIFLGITPDPDNNNKVLKTARGIKISYKKFYDESDMLTYLKENRYSIYSIEKTNNSIELSKINNIDKNICLIFGNEEFGISAKLLRLSDRIIHIDMAGTKKSINVSVAAGIALYKVSNLLK